MLTHKTPDLLRRARIPAQRKQQVPTSQSHYTGVRANLLIPDGRLIPGCSLVSFGAALGVRIKFGLLAKESDAGVSLARSK
jgi:hypothetical protein